MKELILPKDKKDAARRTLRALVRGMYDLQKIRISQGNRLVANFRAKLGLNPSDREDMLDADAKDILAWLRKEYRRIADGIVDTPTLKTYPGDGVISDFSNFALVKSYNASCVLEEENIKLIAECLKGYPIWTYLNAVKGVGPLMGGILISEIDIGIAQYPSQIWQYSGLSVAKDGQGMSKRKEHLILKKYTDRNGEKKEKLSITYNPFLKSKLMGVLAGQFLRQSAEKSPYRKIYDDYKHRLETHPVHKEKTKGHRHNMAMRYMVKVFLIHLHSAWRQVEGLPPSLPYHEAKQKAVNS